jgi:hypothetical protein
MHTGSKKNLHTACDGEVKSRLRREEIRGTTTLGRKGRRGAHAPSSLHTTDLLPARSGRSDPGAAAGT